MSETDADATPTVTEADETGTMQPEMQILPRGGVREVGRSCFEIDVGDRTYLVDCGIKQGYKTEYPLFRGLGPGEVDAVFLTHAHVDHIGALPVAEQRGLLADDAPIIATRPTNALAHILLHDSLKIHKLQAEELGEPQQFTAEDVEKVLNRFEGHGYEGGSRYNIGFRFGHAGHLLGSTWLALDADGRRVVFSGDLGGRSGHLPAIEEPPLADELILESTYGDTLTHPSLSSAKNDLYETVVEAQQNDQPVLIPTFGIGRSQEVLQLFREREATLEQDVDGEVDVVYDGMIRDSMAVYNAFATDQHVAESLVNYRINAEDPEPFVPDSARTPETVEDRHELVDGEDSPVIVAPSGMFTGGWSPFYLWQMSQHYQDAKVVFTGYQAEGTTGRDLLEEPGDVASVTVSALMAPEEADDSEAEEFAFHDVSIDVPTRWLHSVEGFSGHAAANDLLEFARDTEAPSVSLVHGDPASGEHLKEHIEANADADSVSVAERGEPILVGKTGAVPNDLEQLQQRHDRLENEMDALAEEIERLEHEWKSQQQI
ncbi:MBL fold metallo-hydrolase [Halococcus salifodinae]|uniref:MBL fold metallo-hydrolase n=1 Tax=Halococcus salifodinae TaxID=36738 RepID=UPI003F860A3E